MKTFRYNGKTHEIDTGQEAAYIHDDILSVFANDPTPHDARCDHFELEEKAERIMFRLLGS